MHLNAQGELDLGVKKCMEFGAKMEHVAITTSITTLFGDERNVARRPEDCPRIGPT